MNTSIIKTLHSLDVSQLKEAREIINGLLSLKCNRSATQSLMDTSQPIGVNNNINDYVQYNPDFVTLDEKELLMAEIDS